jgi:anti-sigma B factor antagonist
MSMEITTRGYEPVELITIKGRVDSIEAAGLANALKAAHQRGRHTIIVDMSQVEYMSSAGFRALGDAQRNLKRQQSGEVILAQVPDHIREALELVGFTEYFHISESVAAAMEYAANLSAGDSMTGNQPSPA